MLALEVCISISTTEVEYNRAMTHITAKRVNTIHIMIQVVIFVQR